MTGFKLLEVFDALDESQSRRQLDYVVLMLVFRSRHGKWLSSITHQDTLE